MDTMPPTGSAARECAALKEGTGRVASAASNSARVYPRER